MSKEILLVVEAVSNEKGVSADIIFEALELALATATKKRYEGEVELRVAMDKNTGEYETFRRWKVVSDESVIEFPEAEITLSEALEKDESMEVGAFDELPVESMEYGRVGCIRGLPPDG